VSVNILQAHLETLRGEGCGTMIFTLDDPQKRDPVLHYLKTRGATAEVMGYVSIH
jgi:hypothetical protein